MPTFNYHLFLAVVANDKRRFAGLHLNLVYGDFVDRDMVKNVFWLVNEFFIYHFEGDLMFLS